MSQSREQRVAEATAYVRSRFFPPLHASYGELAVTALEEYAEYGPDSHVNLPEDLPMYPKQVQRDEDGDLYVTAADLINTLRIQHLVEDDDV